MYSSFSHTGLLLCYQPFYINFTLKSTTKETILTLHARQKKKKKVLNKWEVSGQNNLQIEPNFD